MADKEISAILGLKQEIKSLRQRARALSEQNERWRSVTRTLRSLAGLPDEQYRNLLQSQSLPPE